MSARRKYPPYHRLDQDLAARTDLTSSDKVVYSIVANLSNINGNGQAWPGLRELGRKAGLKPDTIQVCVDRLIGAKFLTVDPGHPAQRGQPGRSNRYIPVQKDKWPPSVPKAGAPRRPERPANGDASAPKKGTPAPRKPGRIRKKKTVRKKGAAPSAPPDARVRTFIDAFCELYQEKTARGYVVTGGKDGALVKALLKALDAEGVADPVGELLRAATNMLNDPWGADRASISLLSSQVNGWRRNGQPGDSAVGGQFTPAGTTPERAKLLDSITVKSGDNSDSS